MRLKTCVLQDQRKFRTELTALENELADKEDRFRSAVSTRQEFAGQLVAAQQRELAVMAENAKLIETRVSINQEQLIDIDYDRSSDGTDDGNDNHNMLPGTVVE